MPATRIPKPTIEQQRVQVLLSLGFNATQASLLAATRYGGEHIEASEVEQMIKAGCSHDTALRILL